MGKTRSEKITLYEKDTKELTAWKDYLESQTLLITGKMRSNENIYKFSQMESKVINHFNANMEGSKPVGLTTLSEKINTETTPEYLNKLITNTVEQRRKIVKMLEPNSEYKFMIANEADNNKLQEFTANGAISKALLLGDITFELHMIRMQAEVKDKELAKKNINNKDRVKARIIKARAQRAINAINNLYDGEEYKNLTTLEKLAETEKILKEHKLNKEPSLTMGIYDNFKKTHQTVKKEYKDKQKFYSKQYKEQRREVTKLKSDGEIMKEAKCEKLTNRDVLKQAVEHHKKMLASLENQREFVASSEEQQHINKMINSNRAHIAIYESALNNINNEQDLKQTAKSGIFGNSINDRAKSYIGKKAFKITLPTQLAKQIAKQKLPQIISDNKPFNQAKHMAKALKMWTEGIHRMREGLEHHDPDTALTPSLKSMQKKKSLKNVKMNLATHTTTMSDINTFLKKYPNLKYIPTFAVSNLNTSPSGTAWISPSKDDNNSITLTYKSDNEIKTKEYTKNDKGEYVTVLGETLDTGIKNAEAYQPIPRNNPSDNNAITKEQWEKLKEHVKKNDPNAEFRVQPDFDAQTAKDKLKNLGSGEFIIHKGKNGNVMISYNDPQGDYRCLSFKTDDKSSNDLSKYKNNDLVARHWEGTLSSVITLMKKMQQPNNTVKTSNLTRNDTMDFGDSINTLRRK